MQQSHSLWEYLEFSDTPPSERLRAKELFFILSSLVTESNQLIEDETALVSVDEVVAWTEELEKCCRKEPSLALISSKLIEQIRTRLLFVDNKKIVSDEDSCELLKLISNYNELADPSPKTVLREIIINRKLNLLCRIAEIIGIIAGSETKKSFCRHTQFTQSICDQVCYWVESNLGLELKRYNIYQLYLWEYEDQDNSGKLLRLKEIGLRSGILAEEVYGFNSNLDNIGFQEVEVTINWVFDRYGIALSKPIPVGEQHCSEENSQSGLVEKVKRLKLVFYRLFPSEYNLVFLKGKVTYAVKFSVVFHILLSLFIVSQLGLPVHTYPQPISWENKDKSLLEIVIGRCFKRN